MHLRRTCFLWYIYNILAGAAARTHRDAPLNAMPDGASARCRMQLLLCARRADTHTERECAVRVASRGGVQLCNRLGTTLTQSFGSRRARRGRARMHARVCLNNNAPKSTPLKHTHTNTQHSAFNNNNHNNNRSRNAADKSAALLSETRVRGFIDGACACIHHTSAYSIIITSLSRSGTSRRSAALSPGGVESKHTVVVCIFNMGV